MTYPLSVPQIPTWNPCFESFESRLPEAQCGRDDPGHYGFCEDSVLPAEFSWWSGDISNRAGWWFGTWLLWLSIYWEFHNPNWRTHIFQRAWSTTKQRDLNRGNDDKASNLWRYPLFKQTKKCCLELLVSCGKSLLLRWCGEKGVFVI